MTIHLTEHESSKPNNANVEPRQRQRPRRKGTKTSRTKDQSAARRTEAIQERSVKKTRTRSNLEQVFATEWARHARGYPEPEAEHRFAPPRRWRFDFAWPAQKVAVECDGGTWTKGRHSTGTGFTNDCHKLNCATVEGWMVLRFTTDMLRDDPAACIALVVEALDQRSK